MNKPYYFVMGKIYEANKKGEKRLFENLGLESLKTLLKPDEFTEEELVKMKNNEFNIRSEKGLSKIAKENYNIVRSYVRVFLKEEEKSYIFAALEETDNYVVIDEKSGLFKFYDDVYSAIKSIAEHLSVSVSDVLINKLVEPKRKNYMPIKIETITKLFGNIPRVEVEEHISKIKSFENLQDYSFVRWTNNNYFLIMHVIDKKYILNVLFIRSSDINASEYKELKRKGYQEIHACFDVEPMEEMIERCEINI